MNPAIPLIDVSGLGVEETATQRVAAAIGAACRDIGFFYVGGHGVPQALIDAAFAASRRFFAAPGALKDAVSIKRSPHNRGYVGPKVESLDPSKLPDLKEAFNIGLDLAPDDPEIRAGVPFRGVNLWPEQPGFRETMTAYYDAVWALGRRLHEAVALDLGLEPSFFAGKLDRPLAILRLLHYPRRPDDAPAGELGAGEHTDYGNITLLHTDDAGGLEVRTRQGQWLAAPVIPGAFVCNIGDCLMRWTNDVYVSTPHRVINPTGRERDSIAFFLDANPDALVECLPTCRGAGAKYPPVTAADYLRSRLDATYKHRQEG